LRESYGKEPPGYVDENGNWWCGYQVGDPEKDDFDLISFCIIPGFPRASFLRALADADSLNRNTAGRNQFGQ
jgi:hypothetical protein